MMSLFRVRTLAEASAQDRDNFLLLRLVAASLVIYGHGPAVSRGASLPDFFAWIGTGSYSGELAVFGFFLISGFMIAGSYVRRRHLPSFLWARFLRIYPAYLFCLVITAFVLGSIFTTLPIGDYLSDKHVFRYVTGNLELKIRYHLPGVFDGQLWGGAVNGSIWTLPAEVRMYLWIALVGATGILARKHLATVVIVALVAWGIMKPTAIPMLSRPEWLAPAAYFALGAFCYVNRQWVYVGWPVVLVTIGVAWLAHESMLYPLALSVAIASFAFAFAYDTRWYGYNRFGDYSYGLYLWGYPIQQSVAHYLPNATGLVNSAIAWPLAMTMAVISWHLIEKPALRLKPRPGTRFAWLTAPTQRFGRNSSDIAPPSA